MNKWLKMGLILVVIIAVLWALGAALGNWMKKRDVQEVDASRTVEILSVDPNTVTTTSNRMGEQLKLEFIRPTSVMITDADGGTLAQGRQNVTLNLQGKAPFNIRLDDAGAVKLSLNNEVINLSTHTNSSGSADFTLRP